jgi:hypothetical protein
MTSLFPIDRLSPFSISENQWKPPDMTRCATLMPCNARLSLPFKPHHPHQANQSLKSALTFSHPSSQTSNPSLPFSLFLATRSTNLPFSILDFSEQSS